MNSSGHQTAWAGIATASLCCHHTLVNLTNHWGQCGSERHSLHFRPFGGHRPLSLPSNPWPGWGVLSLHSVLVALQQGLAQSHCGVAQETCPAPVDITVLPCKAPEKHSASWSCVSTLLQLSRSPLNSKLALPSCSEHTGPILEGTKVSDS
jgi:hypothetical protein